MNNDANTKGKIITFYSYKGGTGRSMALANVAVLSARSGFRTLMIDWDLEAPGLHKYFANHIDKSTLDSSLGLIDLFFSLQQKVDAAPADIDSNETQELLSDEYVSQFIIPTQISNLSLFKAGLFDKGYQEKINTLNWERIFKKSEGLFFHFLQLLSRKYDFIFIDSRTGYTDASGICTMILPEKLVLVFTPNSQSLDGVIELSKKAAKYRLNSDDLRPMSMYPLPSRIENAEKELRDKWRSEFTNLRVGYQPAFEMLFEEIYDINIDMTQYFNEVQIQHEAKYAYGEEIAVLGEASRDRLSLSESYNKFYNWLNQEQAIWSYKVKQTKTVFLSYSNEDKMYSTSLAKELKRLGFDVWTDNELTIGSDWSSLIQKSISDSDIYLPIITTKYLNSKISHFELSAILDQNRLNEKKVVHPVIIDRLEIPLPTNLANFNQVIVNLREQEPFKVAAQSIVDLISRKESSNITLTQEPYKYEYDVYISYADSKLNQQWMETIFMPFLKEYLNEEMPYEPKIFYDKSSGSLSYLELNQVKPILSRSKILIPVLSPPYFRSQQRCLGEFLFFKQKSILTGADLIYPVLYRNIEPLPEVASSLAYQDFTRFNVVGDAFFKTSLFLDFQKQFAQFAKVIAKSIMKAPPFDISWSNIKDDQPVIENSISKMPRL